MSPILCDWTGEAFQPRRAFMGRCNEELVVHEVYRVEIRHERSHQSHNHYFACIHEAWLNVPDNQADRWPTEDHLRKWALIQAGYRDVRSIVADSNAQAHRIATLIRQIDDYSVVVVSGHAVEVLTATSQKLNAMGREEFQQSKDAVLAILANLVEVSQAQLEQEGRAAERRAGSG